ncbi:IS200/IS605 family element transposase accessory protein TnpB [Candidatus Poribacteria bacterium]|nr:IS200/IS605 family element transposase accessory protein TnpB [Candidatus Poribacteria bacterium]
MALKAHKIALRPTDAQVVWFQRQCGYARFAFNSALADFKAGLSDGVFRSFIDLNNRWNERKKELDWAGEQDQRAALYGVKNLSDAVERWQKKQNGFPKFKKRDSRQSYTVEGYQCSVDGKRIKLPKIGTVKMFSELRFEGKIKRVTVSRTAHRWFASILVDTGTPNVPRDTRGLPVVGIDVGINTLATLDDGTKYENPRPLKQYERKLAREQRKLSRKVFLSKNWYKQKQIVERIHYRIACIRRDAHHKATTAIVKSAAKIGIETLSVTNLFRNKNLAKALSDAALGGFLEKLKTKAETLGIPVVQADRFFASSKTCSSCGHKKDDLTLSDRHYHCSHCGASIDRDVNAAINLRNLAAGYAES